MQIKQILKQLGLNERHAAIYLACLELGSASIQTISNKSGFARSTCESVLASLQEKGFVTAFRKKRTRFFSPEEPKKLISIAKEKVELLESALPQFRAHYFKGNVLPTVRLYQGEAGVKIALREILDEAKELVGFGSVDDIFRTLENFFKIFTKERMKRKIPLKIILRDSPLARERQKLGSQQLREVRLMPEQSSYSSMTFIWNNKVLMCSLQDEIIALVIESRELADSQRIMFNLIWENLPTPATN
ncbi:MAG: helix-turn-helix domain-containing protein [Patescibacteria group bacterium]